MKSHNSPYETDASQIVGIATKVYLPRTLQEIKEAVHKEKSLTIRAGGTGLCGGAVPQEDAILDVSKLCHIDELDLQKKTIVVDAGVILDDLNQYLSDYNLEFPINPSSHQVCTIGGMIATNAVGSRAILYGKTSQWLKWIDVMDCNGEINRKGVTEILDYSGMEGITGLIVRACLKLSPKKERQVKILSFDNLDDVVENTRKLKQVKNVSMIEYLDKQVSSWLELPEKYHLFVEQEDAEGFQSQEEYKKIIELRDKVYPLLAEKGYTRIEDPQVIVDKIKPILQWLEEKNIPTYGHISVGIIHPCFMVEQEKEIPVLMKSVQRVGGKISGEHGIGLTKKEFVEYMDKKIIENIKKRTDGKNKFNRGKII